jgi:hypothetical protein
LRSIPAMSLWPPCLTSCSPIIAARRLRSRREDLRAHTQSRGDRGGWQQ